MFSITILYYPSSKFLPGHIGLKVKSRSDSRSQLCDWGGAGSQKGNLNLYGGDEIAIRLTVSDKTLKQFMDDIPSDEFGYTNNVQQGQYHLLKNNCAHATQALMYHAGYYENKPDKKFGLLPKTVALSACKISLNTLLDQRQELLSTDDIPLAAKVSLLLRLTSSRLLAEKQYSQVKSGVAKVTGVESVINTLSQLSETLYNPIVQKSQLETQQVQTLSQLIADESLEPVTRDELQQCYNLISQEKPELIKATILCQRLTSQIEQDALCSKSRDGISRLSQTIREQADSISEYGKASPEASSARRASIRAYLKVKDMPKMERPQWQSILFDVLFGVVTGFGAAHVVKRIATGSWQFFPAIKSGKSCAVEIDQPEADTQASRHSVVCAS